MSGKKKTSSRSLRPEEIRRTAEHGHEHEHRGSGKKWRGVGVTAPPARRVRPEDELMDERPPNGRPWRRPARAPLRLESLD